MGWSNALRFRFGSLFRSSRLEDEMDQEMRSHYEQLVDDFIASGHDEPEARRLAKREFGNIDRAKEECRDSWGTRLLFDVLRDVRFAARQLLRSKGFASVCVLTIALAIAACATVFSILDSVLFRPLPYASPERLVTIWEVAEYGLNNVAGGAYLDWRERSENLEVAMLHAPVSENLRRDGGAARLRGWEVSASFIDVLGISPLLGRGFLPSEEQVNGPQVVMLTEESWRSRFGADPAIIGSSITLNESPRQVVGVLPADAWLDPKVEFFVPAVLNPDQQFRSGRGSHWAYVLGRLKPGVSAEPSARLAGTQG